MNITEFAQYAGVSKAAVSRYFNGGYLSADKRARIEAAVEATGYHPSIQAQMLRTRRTRQVGVILNLSQKPMRGARRTRQVGVILPKLSSDSCPRIVEGIGSVLEESGYQLLLINTANDPQKELRALDTLCRHTVDGILLIATVYTPEHKAVLERMHVRWWCWGSSFRAVATCTTTTWRGTGCHGPHAGQGPPCPWLHRGHPAGQGRRQQRRAGFEAA